MAYAAACSNLKGNQVPKNQFTSLQKEYAVCIERESESALGETTTGTLVKIDSNTIFNLED